MKKKKILKSIIIGMLLAGNVVVLHNFKNKIILLDNTIIEQKLSIQNLDSALRIKQEETEQLVTDNANLKEQQETLLSELDLARQRNTELTGEIERIEKVESEQRFSRGDLEFSPNQDITIPTVTNGDILDRGLKGKLKGLGWAFVNAGLKYGIDPLFLSAISAQESGWGKYDHGNNNIFGISSGAKYFSSYEECIEYTARLLANYYVAEGRNTPALIQPKYCPSPTNWHYDVAACANTILNGM